MLTLPCSALSSFIVLLSFLYLGVAGNHGREHFHRMSGPVLHTAAGDVLLTYIETKLPLGLVDVFLRK